MKGLAHYQANNWYSSTPSWSFEIVDHSYSGSWTWHDLGDKLPSLFDFLRQMGRLTWQEINESLYRPKTKAAHSRNHAIPVAELAREARDRLEELGLGEIDELFVFRVDYAGRLWGVNIPDSPVFCILWWDGNHRVCPPSS
ncbi:MAG: hypothetical protein LBJ08_00390 [Bifidobacteriaceae bacterium]|jgi:hypothetical protein|nr:hypothetical protein [Bifidobacteriaceae bacterium]